jgi:histidinol-phosphatase (PHP family)
LKPEDTGVTYAKFYEEARKFQEKYKSQITLLVGMETELIHSKTLDELEELRSRFKIDYIVGSVHHVLGHPIDFNHEMYSSAEQAARQNKEEGSESPTEFLFREYFDAQYELLTRAKPDVIGHFDLVRIFRPDFPLSDAVWEKIRRNVAVIVEYGGLVELNSRAWKKNLPDAYPQRDILKVRVFTC